MVVFITSSNASKIPKDRSKPLKLCLQKDNVSIVIGRKRKDLKSKKFIFIDEEFTKKLTEKQS